MNNKKLTLGDKLYKIIGGKVELIRVVRLKNNTVIVKDEDGVNRSVTYDSLDEYIKLRPDARVTFSIVVLEQNMKDIIVSIHREKDIDAGVTLPYAACRQNILDIFANQITDDKTYYIGCSLSKDTCPADVDYSVIVACNGIDKMYMISAYIDDKLEDWLSLIPTGKFNNVLSNIYGSIGNANLQGYSETLKELLEVNYIMYDFHKGFNIDSVQFKVKYNENSFELDSDQTRRLEDIYKSEMSRTYVLKYNKEVDIDKIKRHYVLISDKDNDLYIIAYDKGEYVNRVYANNIHDKRDAVAMLKYKINK